MRAFGSGGESKGGASGYGGGSGKNLKKSNKTTNIFRKPLWWILI